MDDRPVTLLLRQYAAILTELRRRGVVRTNNAPLGDYAEYLAAKVYGIDPEPNSNKSYDLKTPDGTRIQVKARAIGPDTRPQQKFSPFRSFDFDKAVFIAFGLSTYELIWAREVPVAEVQADVSFSAHVNGSTIRIGTAAKLGTDVTAAFQRALEA